VNLFRSASTKAGLHSIEVGPGEKREGCVSVCLMENKDQGEIRTEHRDTKIIQGESIN
jgi:hypothetical protein